MLVSLHSDDKVEEDKLATSFDVTCRAWKMGDIDHVLRGFDERGLVPLLGPIRRAWREVRPALAAPIQ